MLSFSLGSSARQIRAAFLLQEVTSLTVRLGASRLGYRKALWVLALVSWTTGKEGAMLGNSKKKCILLILLGCNYHYKLSRKRVQ